VYTEHITAHGLTGGYTSRIDRIMDDDLESNGVGIEELTLRI
jgi:hypothetical protein